MAPYLIYWTKTGDMDHENRLTANNFYPRIENQEQNSHWVQMSSLMFSNLRNMFDNIKIYKEEWPV